MVFSDAVRYAMNRYTFSACDSGTTVGAAKLTRCLAASKKTPVQSN